MPDKLIELRKRKNLTIQNMADAIGIAKSTYASYETGYRQPPIDVLIKIADFFAVSLDTLVNRHHTAAIHLDRANSGDYRVYIDNSELKNDEIKEIIAYVKVKRKLPL
ncbi:helix-turn-helix domain-containing protein [Sporolactobacillus sp. KGMB 08714]|uniref:helix-turn-helix domain-containing protein n=1 Tax=Sporolactobacillus sp. KGMB 08714 TaxID=3064704 RepID=UPI002FBD796B